MTSGSSGRTALCAETYQSFGFCQHPPVPGCATSVGARGKEGICMMPMLRRSSPDESDERCTLDFVTDALSETGLQAELRRS